MEKKNYIMPLMQQSASLNCVNIIAESPSKVKLKTEEQYSKQRNFISSDFDEEDDESTSFYTKY